MVRLPAAAPGHFALGRVDIATEQYSDRGGSFFFGEVAEIGSSTHLLVSDGLNPPTGYRVDISQNPVVAGAGVPGAGAGEVAYTDGGTYVAANGMPLGFPEYAVADLVATGLVYSRPHEVTTSGDDARSVAYTSAGGGMVAGGTGNEVMVFADGASTPIARFEPSGVLRARGVDFAADGSAVYIVVDHGITLSLVSRDLAPPVVTSVDPATDRTLGGATVTIHGSGFDGATGVDFGTTPATYFYVVDDTEISVSVPPRAAGVVPVKVTTLLGSSASGSGSSFTYFAARPDISEVTPSTGGILGDGVVHILGSSLTEATSVRFGDVEAFCRRQRPADPGPGATWHARRRADRRRQRRGRERRRGDLRTRAGLRGVGGVGRWHLHTGAGRLRRRRLR